MQPTLVEDLPGEVRATCPVPGAEAGIPSQPAIATNNRQRAPSAEHLTPRRTQRAHLGIEAASSGTPGELGERGGARDVGMGTHPSNVGTNPRAVGIHPSNEFVTSAKESLVVDCFDDVVRVLEARKSPQCLVLVTGSLYLVGAALRNLTRPDLGADIMC